METALKSWELENGIEVVDPHRDALYNYSAAEQKAINENKPWRTDPHHFKNVRISAVALLKMVMHARSGGSIEVMGLMQGSVQGDTFVVTDAFRLPVEGTETRVNAQDEANEYMVSFLQSARDSGQMENAVGWYHSHPGYGCWLSGIDVNTQADQQQYSDPFLAVVIDPERTVSAGKVEIGAFRTFPADYKPAGGSSGGGRADSDPDGFQTIPTGKIEDFGAHSSRYYSLDVSHFKSSLDARLLAALWNKYWVSTLAASPLLSNRDYGSKQMADLARKLRQAERAAAAHARGSQGLAGAGPPSGVAALAAYGAVGQLEKVAKVADKLAAEEEAGLLASKVKERIFNFHAAEPQPAPVS